MEHFLKVDRELLDPHFDGYKLSLDNLPKYSIGLSTAVDVVPLREDQYTLMHVRSFGMTNHLVLDHWNPSCTFFVDEKWNVRQLRVVRENLLDSPNTVFTIPHKDQRIQETRLNVTFGFPSRELCILSDGAGCLYLLGTADRDAGDAVRWQILSKEEVCGPDVSFVLVHSMVHQDSSDLSVECLLLHIDAEKEEAFCEGKENENSKQKEASSSSFCAYLEWISFTRSSDSCAFKLHRHRTLKSKAAPIYSAIDESGKALYLAGERHFEFVADSLKPLKKEVDNKEDEIKEDKEDAKEEETKPSFTWTQTTEDVTAYFVVPEETQKPDIHFVLTKNHLELGIKNGDTLLKGPLFRDIDVQLTTWTLEGRKLEVCLAKMDEECMMWSELVIGDTSGEYVVDQDQARIIHDRLAHLTSEEANPNSGVSSCPSEMEECDAYPEVSTMMVRIDGEEHKITHSANIGMNQYLFSAQLEPDMPPCICLRHDVDGVVWQPEMQGEGSFPWKHHATFNALGYVQASKRDCKFGSCAPNTSYAVLCDCVRHIYVYRQPESISSEMRNRKSGVTLSKVAKQQLVSLDCQDDVQGMQVTNERIFILTKKRLYVIRTKTE